MKRIVFTHGSKVAGEARAAGRNRTGSHVVEELLTPNQLASKSSVSPAELIKMIEGGLPIQELNVLQAGLDLPMEKLVPKLGMSKATFHRRKLQGRLGPEESDRM